MTLFSRHYIPITIVLGFNLFTLLIFFTAPIQWKTNNLALFTLFVLFCQILMVIGYYLGYRIGLSKSKNPLRKKNLFHDISSKSLIFIFIFYALTFLIRYAYLLRFHPLEIKGMFQFLLLGIVDPHLGYSLTVDPTRPPTIPWTIYFIISVINQVFFIIGFVCWKRYTVWQKLLFIFFVLIEIFFWIGRATNMGIISLITTYLFAQMLKFNIDPLKSVKPVKPILIVLTSLIISISVFSFTLNTRKGSSAIDYQEFNLGYSKVNENSKIFSVLPKPLLDTYMYVTSYFSQGYYHTCLALDLGYRPTYFLGNNPAVISFAELLGIYVWKDTYVYRLNVKGVDPLLNWHSAYLWWASDVSFWGVPFLLFTLGYMFGFSWALSRNNNDFLSAIVFIIFGNMLLFLFANNSYLSSVFYSFTFILAIWYFTRIKRFKVQLKRFTLR